MSQLREALRVADKFGSQLTSMAADAADLIARLTELQALWLPIEVNET
jgi:hypothetical protein